MATKLEKLSIEELSGVENPANETPGWLVMKSNDDREVLMKEVDRMESDFAILYASLKAVEPYMADAPEDVVAAQSALVTYVESLFSGDEENTEPSPDEGETEVTPVKQSADSNARSLMSVIFGEKVVKEAELDASEVILEDEVQLDDVDIDVEKSDDEELASEPAEVEADEAEAEIEVEAGDDVAKSDDDEALIAVLQRIAKAQEAASEDAAALRGALEGVIDRVERLEVRKTSLSADIDEAITKNTVDPLRAAVHSALSGNRVTIT